MRIRERVLRALISTLVVYLFAAALWPRLAAAQAVPTPASVLGHTPGDDFYLANYDESIAYFHKMAESSNRIKMFTVGKTTRVGA